MIALLLIMLAQVEPSTQPSATAELSRRTRAILARLAEPVALMCPNATPFDDVLQAIKRAARRGPNDPGLPIYIDPLGLQDAERSMNSTVTINVKDAPLKVALERILAQLGLAYIVTDDVLIISSPKRIERERQETTVVAADASPRTRIVLAKLKEPIAMRFGNETPLGDVLKYIPRAVKKLPGDAEIEVLISLTGLQEVERSLNSTVLLDLEGVSLQTSLRLLLQQLGLAYVVKDGLVIISSHERIRNLKESAGRESK